MKRFALALVVVMMVTAAIGATAHAASAQQIETLMGKVLETYTLPTDFGNVYFNQGDIKRFVHAAAKMRPVDLGLFTTDTGHVVRIKATHFDRGVATLLVTVK